MTLAELGPHGIKTYHREKRKVRLASGLNDANQLDQAAQARALETLGIFGQILEEFQPDDVRAVGTFTFRTAVNIHSLTQQALKLLPYPIEILSGTEEARLIYQGVSHDQHLPDNTLVVDIGGGSTELIIGKTTEAKLLHSCNMGCVSLSERFFPSGEISARSFERACLFSSQQLESIRVRYLAQGWQMALGSSGTIKSLSQCAQSLELSDGSLTLDILKDLRHRFIAAGHIDHLDIPGLSEDRRSIICSGLAILIAVFDILEVTSMSYSDAALREGLLLEVQDRLKHHDIRHHSVALLAKRFASDQHQAQKVSKTALSMFDAVAASWEINNPDYRQFLHWACQLHEVGHQINHLSCHKHAAYIVNNSAMAGFNAEQQSILAFMLLSQRKSLKLESLPAFEVYNETKTLKIILLLRLAIRLNQFRQSDTLDSFGVSATERTLTVRFHSIWNDRQELFSNDLDAEQEQFEPLQIELSYEFLS
nr:exopolyphosphatase [Aestuariicella hydrocarbonica]